MLFSETEYQTIIALLNSVLKKHQKLCIFKAQNYILLTIKYNNLFLPKIILLITY